MTRIIKTIILAFIFGLLGGAVSNIVLDNDSQESMIKDFYDTENLVSVSPHDYVGNPKDYVMVDLRSKPEYDNLHLAGAINIPAGSMNEQELVQAFKELDTTKVVTYCYSISCMLSRNVGKALSDNNVYVKHLTAGWYELKRDYFDYLIEGQEPGAIISGKPEGCAADGSLGC